MATFIFLLYFVSLILIYKQKTLHGQIVFFIGLALIVFWLNHHATTALNLGAYLNN